MSTRRSSPFFLRRRSKRGFSFLEVIIALAIVAVASAGILTARQSFSFRSLDATVEGFAAVVRRAQELSMSNATFNGSTVRKGYGVWVSYGPPDALCSPTTNYCYKLFANTGPGNRCVPGEQVEVVSVPQSFQINYDGQASLPASGDREICFRSDGTAYRININDTNEQVNALYTFRRSSGALARSVRVLTDGTIRIE
ncbi:MAG: type II secretion system protein [Parcubacteria group bacterium]|nr:type II secretion system protein [Parcubacteria group bacterium]